MAPPKKKRLDFYKKLENKNDDTTAAQLSNSLLDNAVKEVDSENKASTTISAVLRGHKGRLDHSYMKNYPEIAKKRLEDVKKMDPRTELTYKPVGKDEKPEKPAYLQFLEKKR